MAIQLYLALRIVVLPVGICALALLVARFLGRGPAPVARIAALGAGGAALAADLGLAGLPPLPPIDSIGWIPVAVVVALALVPFLERGRSDLVLLALVGAAAAYLVGKPGWTAAGGAAAALWIAVFAVAVGVVVEGLTWAASRLPSLVVLLSATVACVGGALACTFSHSALLGMILGAVAAAAGTLGVGGAILRVGAAGRAVFGLLAIPAGCLLLYGRLFSALPAQSLALLVAAALAPVAVARFGFRGRSLAALALTVVLAGGAVGIAYRAGEAAENAPGANLPDDMQ